jgi:DNA polymerase-4
LLATAQPLIELRGLTLVGIAVGNLADDSAVQLALSFDHRRVDELDAALDDIHNRFGPSAITRAVLLGRRHELTMPMLPD